MKGGSLQDCVNGLTKGVSQRQRMAATLLQLAAEERQLISLLPLPLPYHAYSPYLHDGAYLVLKVSGEREPIWVSDNLQLVEVGVVGGLGSLESNVHQMHDNLAKYESVIASLKQLKEMEQLDQPRQCLSKDTQETQAKLKRFIVTLEKEIFEARSQISILGREKEQLISRMRVLQQKEKNREQLRTLENRFKQCNDVSLSQQPKRRQKRVLLNY